jgi:hypothetical protein
MTPIREWCKCGWGKHYTWMAFIRCCRRFLEAKHPEEL